MAEFALIVDTIIGAFGIIFLGYFVSSIKTVRGDQRVLHLRFGKPIGVKKSGLRIKWKWIDQWIIYSTKEHCLSYDPIRMFTKKGKWGGSGLAEYEKYLAETEKKGKEIEELERKELSSEEKNRLAELKKDHREKSKREKEERETYKKDAEEYDAAEIPVGATLYFWWPEEQEDIIKAFQFGPSPGDPEDPKYIEKLKKEFEDVIMGSLREIVGDMTWGEVVSRREQIAKRLKERLMEHNSPFERAKIKNFYVVISEVDLPDDLKKLLTKRQEEKLRADAAEQTARRLDLEIGEGIGRAAKTLKEAYKFPQEKAEDAAIERHGDILAAREGDLKRIQWISKGGGSGSGGSDISPQNIARAIVIAQEMWKKSIPGTPTKKTKEPGEPKTGEASKPPETKPKTFAQLAEETGRQRKEIERKKIERKKG